MDRPIVIKIGGSVADSTDVTVQDIVALQRRGKPVIVVHGGGALITGWLKKQGVATRFIQGERVTDSATLDVVIAVLAGLANKQTVAAINAAGGRAVGISGVDGNLVQGRIKSAELGYVGNVVKVEPALFKALLNSGFVPVVSPVSVSVPEKPGELPQIININGDPVAGEIAAAVSAERLIFMTDVAGISGKDGKLFSRLSVSEAEALIASGVASGGMIPKIRACIRALSATPVTRIIDGREPHILLKELENGAGGTTIYK